MDRLADLYQRQFPFVCRVLSRAGAPAAEVDALAHDVFLVVLRKPWPEDVILTEDKECARLYAIADLELSNHRQRARFRRTEPLDEDIHQMPTAGSEGARLEARNALDWLLARTPRKRREVFELVEIEGFSVVSAALVLNISESAAHERLALARQDIAAAMKKLEQMDKDPDQKKKSALLVPFGVGAWHQYRALHDPPAGTAERVWQQIEATRKALDLESGQPSSPPPTKPPVRVGLRRLPGHVKAVFKATGGYIGAACGGGALVAVLFLVLRAPARIVILRLPKIVVVETSQSTVPAQLPVSTATPSPTAELSPTVEPSPAVDATDEEQRIWMRKANSALALGNRQGTLDALDAYNQRFPQGKFRSAAQALRLLVPAEGGE